MSHTSVMLVTKKTGFTRLCGKNRWVQLDSQDQKEGTVTEVEL